MSPKWYQRKSNRYQNGDGCCLRDPLRLKRLDRRLLATDTRPMERKAQKKLRIGADEDQAILEASIVILEWAQTDEPTAKGAARKILKIYRKAGLLKS